ncbi:MAG TPA: hypothetical protein VF707_10175 [Ardenticatenaceae bacterium]|jgi:uncharacterized protein (DUF697 family)
MSLSALGNIWNIVSEIDLNGLKREAERQFTILIAGGEEAPARMLAERLSEEPGKAGVHPWMVLQSLPLPVEPRDLSQYNLALLVTGNLEMTPVETTTLQRLHDARVPVVVVVVNEGASTQVGAELARRYEAARVVLRPTPDAQSIQARLIPAILRAAPEKLRLALARQLPPLRAALSREIIEGASRANAIYSASTGVAQVVPVLNLPFAAADVIVLTKNQLVMAYKIALLAGKQGDPRDIMGEVVSVVGGGLLFRQAARELVGLIPVLGIVPKVAVAYAGTLVIGRTVHLWATKGQKLTTNEVRRFYQEALERGRAVAERTVERVRQERTALAGGERRPWWRRVLPRRAPRALPAPTSGLSGAELEVPVPSEAAGTELALANSKPGLWQRLRRRLPFRRAT